MSTHDTARQASELGAALAGLGILTETQWQQAVVRAGGDAQLPAVLDILTRTPAAWSAADGGARSTVLSAHQLKQIQRCLSEDAIPKLHRALQWNGYYILDPIGKGGMGIVYKGWDVENKRFVAIKRTHRESPEVAKRLRREAKLQLSLDHSNIARLYSLEKYGKTELLVMEYLPGNTLSEVLQKRGRDKPLPWQFVAEMAAQMCDALAHAHGANPRGVTVVHRDIKPGNIMLMRQKGPAGEKYVPKLLDMGLAKSLTDVEAREGQDTVSVDEPLTRQFQILGTPEYMAPEQWEGGLAALPESDVYCLGGSLVYALIGEVPFPGVNKGNKMTYFAEMSHRHSAAPRPTVRGKRPDVPVELERLLQQMMAVAPSHRGSPAKLRDQFNALVSQATKSAARAGGAGAGSGVMPSVSGATGDLTAPPPARAARPKPSAQSPVSGDSAAGRPTVSNRAGSPTVRNTVQSPRQIDDVDDSDLEVTSMARKGGERLDDADYDDDDDDDDDRDEAPVRHRPIPNPVAGIGRRANKIFDPDRDGERTRAELAGTVGDWFRGLARPDQRPVTFGLVLAMLVGIGFAVAWEISAFVAVLLGMGVGFAYAARGPIPEE